MSRKASLSVRTQFSDCQPFLCSAQVEQGAITGSVVDQTGASVASAEGHRTNVATQAAATTETNVDGYYKIPYLLAGSYNLAVEKGDSRLPK